MFSRLGAWFAAQSPRGQILSGCLGTIVLMTSCLYVLGAGSYLIGPLLTVSPAVMTTVVALPTQTEAASSTPGPAITLALPGSTLVSTPTQAPLPTRAPTSTPTPGEIPSVTPMPNLTPTVEGTATLPTPTGLATTPVPPTATSQPTATAAPSKTQAPPTATKVPKTKTRTP